LTAWYAVRLTLPFHAPPNSVFLWTAFSLRSLTNALARVDKACHLEQSESQPRGEDKRGQSKRDENKLEAKSGGSESQAGAISRGGPGPGAGTDFCGQWISAAGARPDAH